jgi:hypothetical protein
MSKKQIQVIIILLTPPISALMGLLSTLVITKWHFLGLFHVNHDQTAATLTNVTVWALTTGLTYLAAHTKLFPELVKWVEKDILDQAQLTPLEPLIGSIASAPLVTVHGSTVTVHSTPDVTNVTAVGKPTATGGPTA